MCVPERFWDARWDRIQPDLAASLTAYGRNFDEMVASGSGIALWGPNGTGKTSAAVMMMKEARRRGIPGFFVECAKIREYVIGETPFDDSETVWSRMNSVQWLLIDDVGKGSEDKTEFLERKLDELLRHRSSHRRVTWFTTNMTPVQMKAWLKPSALAVMQGYIIPVRAVGTDLRAPIAQEMSAKISNP
jgi:DNA replication protein DnaC